jgi:dUTP pyrophosphatase
MPELPIKLIHPAAQLPTRGNPGDAGLDLYSVEDYHLEMGERYAYDTGLAMAIPAGYVGLIRPRSGWAVKHGIDTMAGVIDPSFRGTVKVVLENRGGAGLRIYRGDRIAQLLILPVPEFEPVKVEALGETARGAGGFGSTGR